MKTFCLVWILTACQLFAGQLNAQEVDLAKSRVYVKVGVSGRGHAHGVEGRLKAGKLMLGAAEHAGSLVFDMTTFTADTSQARQYVGLSGNPGSAGKVTSTLRSAEVLGVHQYPTAKFSIVSAVETEPGRYLLKGEFSLHGVKRALSVAVTSKQQQGQTQVTGKFKIKQTDYGITPYSRVWGRFGVADTLEIWGDVWLK